MIKDMIYKFSKPTLTVLDTLKSSFSSAKACLQLLKPPGFIGCDKVVRCLKKWFPSLFEAIFSQLFHNESDMTGHEEPMEAPPLYMKAVMGRRRRGALDSWCAPLGLSFIQLFH